MRRLYQRRADTMVFVTIAAISVGVLVAYFEMQDRETPSRHVEGADDPPRLVLLPTSDPADVVLDRDVLEDIPRLEAALDEVAMLGSATIQDPALVDAIWFQLADAYGVAPRVPLVLEHDGARYRLQMVA